MRQTFWCFNIRGCNSLNTFSNVEAQTPQWLSNSLKKKWAVSGLILDLINETLNYMLQV